MLEEKAPEQAPAVQIGLLLDRLGAIGASRKIGLDFPGLIDAEATMA
jgi:hypothetical protein